MITGPELAKIHLEVEEQTTNQHDGAYDTGHQHRQDQQSGVQAASVKEDNALVTMLEEMGNPFPEHKQCLLIIASGGSCGFGALGPAILRGPLQGPNDAVVYGKSCYSSRLYESCHLVGNHSHIIITCSRIATN